MEFLFYLLVFHCFIRIVKIHSGCTEILLASFYYKELEVWRNDGEKNNSFLKTAILIEAHFIIEKKNQ